MQRTIITPALLSLGLLEFELRLSGDHEPEAPEIALISVIQNGERSLA
jgi:hypothetical protein